MRLKSLFQFTFVRTYGQQRQHIPEGDQLIRGLLVSVSPTVQVHLLTLWVPLAMVQVSLLIMWFLPAMTHTEYR